MNEAQSAGVVRSIGLAAVMLKGFIDAVERGVVYGWAWNPQRPEERVQVEILHGDNLLATVSADQFRADLLDLEVGDGQHAFEFHLPEELVSGLDSAEIEVRFAGSLIPLPRMKVRPVIRKRADGQERSEAERIEALHARLAMQEQIIADMSNVMSGLVDRLRNLPVPAHQGGPDLVSAEMADEMAKQTKILSNLEIYMTTFGQSLRQLSDSVGAPEPVRPPKAGKVRGMDMVFLGALVALVVGIVLFFGDIL